MARYYTSQFCLQVCSQKLVKKLLRHMNDDASVSFIFYASCIRCQSRLYTTFHRTDEWQIAVLQLFCLPFNESTSCFVTDLIGNLLHCVLPADTGQKSRLVNSARLINSIGFVQRLSTVPLLVLAFTLSLSLQLFPHCSTLLLSQNLEIAPLHFACGVISYKPIVLQFVSKLQNRSQ